MMESLYPDEKSLLYRISVGNENAFIFIFEKYHKKAYRFALKTIKSPAGNSVGKVEAVSLLDYRDRLNFQQRGEGLKVHMRDQAPGKIAFLLKIGGSIV